MINVKKKLYRFLGSNQTYTSLKWLKIFWLYIPLTVGCRERWKTDSHWPKSPEDVRKHKVELRRWLVRVQRKRGLLSIRLGCLRTSKTNIKFMDLFFQLKSQGSYVPSKPYPLMPFSSKSYHMNGPFNTEMLLDCLWIGFNLHIHIMPC